MGGTFARVSLGYTPRNGIAELQGRHILTFALYFQILQSISTNVKSHQQIKRIPASQPSHQYLVLLDILIFGNQINEGELVCLYFNLHFSDY